jgi:hypothetical protein
MSLYCCYSIYPKMNASRYSNELKFDQSYTPSVPKKVMFWIFQTFRVVYFLIKTQRICRLTVCLKLRTSFFLG